MVELVNRLLGRLKVPLRAFCWKARGGGGRLRHATAGEDKSREGKRRERRREEAREEKI